MIILQAESQSFANMILFSNLTCIV